MKILYKFVVAICFLSINSILAQNSSEVIEFDKKDLVSYKIDHHIYNYWSNDINWFNKRRYRVDNTDISPYFTDERQYKGYVNYGIKCFSKDKSNCVINENVKMYFLDIDIKYLQYNSKDSIVSLKGFVKKGWSKLDQLYWENNSWVDNNNINIYIGQKKDTISKLYYEPKKLGAWKDKFIYKFKDKEIKDAAILDSFPSFYMNDFKHFKTKKGNNRAFELKAKINHKSLLVFGLESSYAEIFEIGKLVFDTENKRNLKRKIAKTKEHETKLGDRYFKFIIRNNVQELYKDSIPIPKKSWYYKVTERAENFILKRQYGKAREEYRKLLSKNHYIFSRDLHNAVRATALSRDYKTTKLWCEKLILKGIPLSYFNSQVFNKLRTTTNWSDFLLKYPLLKEQYEKGLNLTLINKLDELVAIDQKDYLAHSKGEFERSELYATTERVNDMFISLLKQEGFPTEEKIGVEMLNDSIPKISPDYQVLITHSHQANSSRLKEIKEILNNNVQNNLYDIARSNIDEMMNMGTCLMLYKGNLYNDKTCGSINKKQVGLIDFSFNNKQGFIIDEGAFSILGYSKENEENDTVFFKERFNFVKKITNDWFEDEGN